MLLVTRRDWDARPRRDRTTLDDPPAGVKIHYVGAHVDPRTVDDHDRCVRLVRTIQDQHMDGNGWSDVGYTALVCSHREILVGRGPGTLPAANGSGLNARHYAVCALVGSSGLVVPPPAMVNGLVDAIQWLRQEGAGREVLGHRDGFATDCPGDWLYRWIQRGHLRPGEKPAKGPKPPPFQRVLHYPPLMKGQDVRLWQTQMAERGWRLGVDGVFGPESQGVALSFQREKGIRPATGRVTKQTWEAAWTAPVT